MHTHIILNKNTPCAACYNESDVPCNFSHTLSSPLPPSYNPTSLSLSLSLSLPTHASKRFERQCYGIVGASLPPHYERRDKRRRGPHQGCLFCEPLAPGTCDCKIHRQKHKRSQKRRLEFRFTSTSCMQSRITVCIHCQASTWTYARAHEKKSVQGTIPFCFSIRGIMP